jgi:hypothetical protein
MFNTHGASSRLARYGIVCPQENRHWTWSWASSSHLWSLQPVFMYYDVTPRLSIFVKYINKRYEVEQKMAAGVLLNRDYSVLFPPLQKIL